MNVMTATFLTAAAATAGAPVAASMLASIASRREDATGTLREKAPGVIAAAARHMLDFHPEYDAAPARPGRGGSRATQVQPVAQQVRQSSSLRTSSGHGKSRSR